MPHTKHDEYFFQKEESRPGGSVFACISLSTLISSCPGMWSRHIFPNFPTRKSSKKKSTPCLICAM